MLRPDSASRRDMITDHAVELIATRGASAVSMTAIGALLGISGQAIAKWCGSVDEMWMWIAGSFCSRWAQWLDERSYACGALALVPHTAEEVTAVRVLLGLEEVVRSRAADLEEIGDLFGELRRHEWALLTSVHPLMTDPVEVDRLHAYAEGLRAATCRVVDALTPAAATTLMAAECRAGAGPMASWVSPTACLEMGLPTLVELNQPGQQTVLPPDYTPRHRSDPPWQEVDWSQAVG